MVEESLSLPQGEIFYLTGGRGPKLVFLHGAIASAQAYLPLLALLSQNYQVVAPIHPGHGRSFPIPPNWQLANFVKVYQDFLQKLDFLPEILMGHSFGGTLALLLAAVGQSQQAAIMDVPGLPFPLTPKSYLRGMLAEARAIMRQKPDLEHLEDTAAAAVTLFQTALRHPEIVAWVFREGPATDISRQLGRIKIPVTIFWGEKDKLVPLEIGERLNRLIKNSQLVVLPDQGHNYPVTDPEFTYRELGRFFMIDKD